MFSKEMLALMLMSSSFVGITLLACISHRIRDALFVLMVVLAPMTERFDVNFVSRDWYRGTVRGFECSFIDVLSLAILVSTFLFPRKEHSRIYWAPSLGFILLYFLYACVNVALAEPKLFGLFELSRMMRGILIFMAVALYVRGKRELRLFVIAWALMVCWQGFLALEQRYRFGIHRVFATLVEANSLSVFFCTAAPVLIAAFNSRLSFMIKALCAAGVALAVVGEILTISRAGVVIFGFVLLGVILATTSFRITVRKIALALVMVLGIAFVAAKSWRTIQARFVETSLEKEYSRNRDQGRGYYLRIALTIAREQVLGVGLNNWSYWVSNKYGPRLGYGFVPYLGTDRMPSDVVPAESTNIDAAQAAPAHNLPALTLGELGVPGLLLLVVLWLRWFQMAASFVWQRTPDPMRRIAVGALFGFTGMFLQNMTEWVFRQSPLSYVFHILLGVLASLYYCRRHERRATARTLREADHGWWGSPAPAPSK